MALDEIARVVVQGLEREVVQRSVRDDQQPLVRREPQRRDEEPVQGRGLLRERRDRG